MTTSKGIRAKDYPSQFSSVADAINLESKIVIGVSYEIQSQILYEKKRGGIARISGLLIFSLLLILLSSCRQTILLPLPDPDADNGEIASGIKINVEGTEITATINEEGKAVLDLSQAVSEKEEIATIKDENGDTIYDVNYPDNTKDGYTYDSTNNTLTIDNIDDLSGGLSITAEKVKVLLYDAALTIDGRNYECPDLKNVDPKGKYSKPSEAWNAAKGEASSFTQGVYILLNSDIEEDSLSFTTSNENTTIDLNKHSWSKATPSSDNRNRIISPTISAGQTVNIINGVIRDGALLRDDNIGAAVYVRNENNGSTSDVSSHGIMNIFGVKFLDNTAEGGGAICINGAIELNIFNSEFTNNKTTHVLQDDETGTGAAIYIWDDEDSGEIVNLYDCSFSGNKGYGLISMETGKKAGIDAILNIYGGSFVGNSLNNYPLLGIQSFNIHGGNFLDETLSNDKGNNNSISISGGIIGTLDINGSTNTLTLNGGSFGILEVDSSTSSTLVSATLPNAAKVEYIEYSTGEGAEAKQVNINSPFNIDSDGDAVYKYETGFDDSDEDKVFNNSEYNPTIKEFNVFLPSSEVPQPQLPCWL